MTTPPRANLDTLIGKVLTTAQKYHYDPRQFGESHLRAYARTLDPRLDDDAVELLLEHWISGHCFDGPSGKPRDVKIGIHPTSKTNQNVIKNILLKNQQYLSNAYLVSACILLEIIFCYADLRGADLSRLDMNIAALISSDMTGANVRGAAPLPSANWCVKDTIFPLSAEQAQWRVKEDPNSTDRRLSCFIAAPNGDLVLAAIELPEYTKDEIYYTGTLVEGPPASMGHSYICAKAEELGRGVVTLAEALEMERNWLSMSRAQRGQASLPPHLRSSGFTLESNAPA
jgi:hypothetical protein